MSSPEDRLSASLPLGAPASFAYIPSPCSGRYLVALGHAYHPEEFVCSQCGKVLEEGGFFEEKGAIFCPSCYDVRYAPSCAKCKKKITGVSGFGRWAGGAGGPGGPEGR